MVFFSGRLDKTKRPAHHGSGRRDVHQRLEVRARVRLLVQDVVPQRLLGKRRRRWSLRVPAINEPEEEPAHQALRVR